MLNAALIAIALTASWNGADEVYAKRALVLKADAQCHWLSSQERRSLEASTRQVRMALSEAGYDVARLDDRIANTVALKNCDDPFLVALAGEARAAHEAWVKTRAMDFPGYERVWTVRRLLKPDAMDRWTLWQSLPGRARFGVTESAEGYKLTLAFPVATEAKPIRFARLEFRDADKLDRPLSLAAPESEAALAGRAAPVQLSRFVWASERRLASGEESPVPDTDYVMVHFPADAMDALTSLTGRESVRIRLNHGDYETTHFVEVGALFAARAFLTADEAQPHVRQTAS